MTYVGCTGDLDKRLERHNSGQVKSSKYYRPFVLIHKEEFATLPEARKKESFYRTTSGRNRDADHGEAAPKKFL